MNPDEATRARLKKMYEQMGTTAFAYTREQYRKMIQPWHPDAQGCIPLLKWHGLDSSIMAEGDRQVWGPSGAGYGAYLFK